MKLAKDTLLFLECSIGQSEYLIDCHCLREVIRLPALTAVPEDNKAIAGLLNFRSELLEVFDGRTLLGYASEEYRLSDKVIIFDRGQNLCGLIVQNTHHVRSISDSEIHNRNNQDSSGQVRFIHALAHTAGGLLSILEPATLLESRSNEELLGCRSTSFISNIRSEDQSEFCQRAETLAVGAETVDGTSVSYAIIELGGERYGIALENVTEFLEVDRISPIPCCPPHVVGNTNWRGDVLTVIDVSSALEVPEVKTKNPQKLVVFGEKRNALGVAVDEIYDVCNIQTSQILTAPSTLKATKDGLLTGVAEHHQVQIGLLSVDTLLAPDKWCVNEMV